MKNSRLSSILKEQCSARLEMRALHRGIPDRRAFEPLHVPWVFCRAHSFSLFKTLLNGSFNGASLVYFGKRVVAVPSTGDFF